MGTETGRPELRHIGEGGEACSPEIRHVGCQSQDGYVSSNCWDDGYTSDLCPEYYRKCPGRLTEDDEPGQEVMYAGAKATEFFRIHDRNVGVQAVPRVHTRGSQAAVTTKQKGRQTMGRQKGCQA